MKLSRKRPKKAGRKKKPENAKKETHKRLPLVLTTEKESLKMSNLVIKCVEVGLKYAYEVLNNDEQVEITRLNKYHQSEVVVQDRYTPEHKIKLLEILVDKVFTDRKEPVDSFDTNDGPRVVGFNFIPIGKGKK